MAPGFPVTDQMVDLAYQRRMSAGDGYTVRTLGESLLRGEDTMDETFSKITVPTLLVWGEKDQFLSLDIARRLQSQVSGSRLVIVAGAGHLPQIDHPAEVGRAISDFVAAK
jgi:triacylglycerol lipase